MNEHEEAEVVMDAANTVSIDNTRSVNEVNRGNAAYVHSKARWRVTISRCMVFACVLATAWSAWLMVKWA
jgi:hypothetical protein